MKKLSVFALSFVQDFIFLRIKYLPLLFIEFEPRSENLQYDRIRF